MGRIVTVSDGAGQSVTVSTGGWPNHHGTIKSLLRCERKGFGLSVSLYGPKKHQLFSAPPNLTKVFGANQFQILFPTWLCDRNIFVLMCQMSSSSIRQTLYSIDFGAQHPDGEDEVCWLHLRGAGAGADRPPAALRRAQPDSPGPGPGGRQPHRAGPYGGAGAKPQPGRGLGDGLGWRPLGAGQPALGHPGGRDGWADLRQTHLR